MQHLLTTWLRRGCGCAIAFLLTWHLSCLPAYATSVYELPDVPETGYLVDQGDVLSRSTEGHINDVLKKLDDKQGQEVYFVTVRRLDYEETIDGFAQKLFSRWFPTADDQVNKTLLILDVQTDNPSIITGSDTKALLSDEIATSIAKETVIVPLKYGNRYNKAFNDAADRIGAVISGQPDPGPPEVQDTINTEGTFATPEETKESNAITWVIVLVVLSTAIPMGTYYLYVYLGNR